MVPSDSPLLVVFFPDRLPTEPTRVLTRCFGGGGFGWGGGCGGHDQGDGGGDGEAGGEGEPGPEAADEVVGEEGEEAEVAYPGVQPPAATGNASGTPPGHTRSAQKRATV